MKRYLVLLLSILLLFSCSSCNDEHIDRNTGETNDSLSETEKPNETNEINKVNFEAQYIRTNGYINDAKYPTTKIIRSVSQLNNYYEENKSIYDLERNDKVSSDSTIGFLDACDKYDEEYFKDHILIMVLLEEGSGSNRHNVNSIELSSSGKLNIYIKTIVPEVGTCDMAEWHLLIEPEAGTTIANENDITVIID